MLNLVKAFVAELQLRIIATLKSEGVKFSRDFQTSIKRMAKGNSKLDNSILIFDLPAGKKYSCCCDCKGCYAKKAQVQYTATNTFRRLNFELAQNHLDILEYLIMAQLKTSKGIKTVRIHSSGDFFSQAYVDMWNRIIVAHKELKFYAYTKTERLFNFFAIQENDNFNLVLSVAELKGKRVLNYGDEKHVQALVDAGYFACPATLKHNSDVICGKDCSYCVNHSKVCFHQH